jgi:uncharacterized membrane protein
VAWSGTTVSPGARVPPHPRMMSGLSFAWSEAGSSAAWLTGGNAGRRHDGDAAASTGRKDTIMTTLVAIGYPDETTATAASLEAGRLAKDMVLQPDAIAVIIRDREGKFHVTTNHHAVGGGATWGMFWGLLFGLLFFVPVMGMAVGAGLGALMGKVTKSGIDKQFTDQVREMLEPGTSALFLVVEQVTPDKAVEALSRYGGRVLKSSLSKQAEAELQEALHGSGDKTEQPVAIP